MVDVLCLDILKLSLHVYMKGGVYSNQNDLVQNKG